MPAEKDDEGQQAHHSHHEPRKQKGEDDGGNEREHIPPDKIFGERHHEREYGDKESRRKQKIHIRAQRERAHCDRAADR